MLLEQLSSAIGGEAALVSFDGYETTQSKVHGIDNLARAATIVLDSAEQVLLLFPAKNDINASLIMNHTNSLSFQRLERPVKQEFDWVALCSSLAEKPDIVVSNAEYTVGLKLEIAALQSKANFSCFPLSGPKKYKARIKKVAPQLARDSLPEKRRCFVGFSLESASFEGNRLGAVLNWIDGKFDSCLILIADSIHTNTLRMDADLSEDQAWGKANELAHRAELESREILETLERCDFKVVRSSEYLQDTRYLSSLGAVEDLYRIDKQFHSSVDRFSDNFASRKNVERRRFLEYSRKYLLEELAVTRCVVEDGWDVLVYPGELNVFDEIADGLHSGIPDALKGLVSVSLAFRPAGQNSK